MMPIRQSSSANWFAVAAAALLTTALTPDFLAAQGSDKATQVSAIGTLTQNKGLVKRLKVVQQVPVTPLERERLDQTLAEIITIYARPDFGSFKRFMAMRKGTPDPRWVQSIRTLPVIKNQADMPAPARKVASQLAGWPSVNEWDTFHVWWAGRYAEGGVWKAIDVPGSFIQIYERVGEPDGQEALVIARTAFTNQNHSLMFQTNHFVPSFAGKAKYAAVYLASVPQGKDPKFPRIFWLRWDGSIKNWVLDRAAQSYAGERSSHCDLLF